MGLEVLENKNIKYWEQNINENNFFKKLNWQKKCKEY